ncbi:MAG: amidohydrolase family protein, partial [Bryobacteraceae bacterium]
MKTFLACALLILTGCSATKQEVTPSATLFEGARLITGDGSTPIENSAFVMENAKITAVGRKGDIMAPAGAAHADLTGKTVMPSLVDTHTHLGWAIIKT